MTYRLLSIAGSDSGGGAGIQADIKTASAFGVYAASAITAITVQNTRGVSAVQALPPDLVHNQIKAVLDDIGADVIKIGMVANEPICRAIASALEGICVPIVLDPVMVSTSGSRLLDSGAVNALLSNLVPKATLLTPNLPELDVLCGLKGANDSARLAAARTFAHTNRVAVLVKGGHGQGATLTNTAITQDGEHAFTYERLDTPHTHGTGCTLSTAIACLLAQGVSLVDAIQRAGDFVHEAIATAPGLGQGHGPLNFFGAKKTY